MRCHPQAPAPRGRPRRRGSGRTTTIASGRYGLDMDTRIDLTSGQPAAESILQKGLARIPPPRFTMPNQKSSLRSAPTSPQAQHVETYHFPYLTRSLAAIPLPCARGRLRELWAIMPGRPQLGRQEVLLDPCLPIPGSLPSVSESESHWRLVLLLQPDSHDYDCGVGSANGYLRVAR